MDILIPHAEGWLLSVKAQPGAKQTKVKGVHGRSLKIAVTAPPEDGKANEALCRYLADLLELPRSQVQLRMGATRREKLFLIPRLDRGEIERRLQAAMT